MIFIDLGAYDGDTIREFFNWGMVFGDPNQAKIYGFEPNPKFTKAHEDIISQHDNIMIEPKAAWINDGTLQFAVDGTETPLGSTAMISKSNIWDHFPKIEVECFDFSTWLKQFKDEYVIVKMDIEGAEFPLLEKMIADGTDLIPAKLLVEFHPNKVKDYSTEDKDNLIKRLKKRGANIGLWH